MKQIWVSLALGMVWLGAGTLEVKAQPPFRGGGYGFPNWDGQPGGYNRPRKEKEKEEPKEEPKGKGKKAAPEKEPAKGEKKKGFG